MKDWNGWRVTRVEALSPAHCQILLVSAEEVSEARAICKMIIDAVERNLIITNNKKCKNHFVFYTDNYDIYYNIFFK